MKNVFPVFALLLALAPVRALSANILWVSANPSAEIVTYRDGAEFARTVASQFQLDGKAVNAARVGVEDIQGTTTYLLVAYEDPGTGNMTVDDASVVADLSGFDTESEGSWITVCLGDFEARDLVVKFELGFVDWDYYDGTVSSGNDVVAFETLACATATLGELADAPNIYEVSSVSPSNPDPWTPLEFTAVPEPSVCLTALFGVLLLSKRRRSR